MSVIATQRVGQNNWEDLMQSGIEADFLGITYNHNEWPKKPFKK